MIHDRTRCDFGYLRKKLEPKPQSLSLFSHIRETYEASLTKNEK